MASPTHFYFTRLAEAARSVNDLLLRTDLMVSEKGILLPELFGLFIS